MRRLSELGSGRNWLDFLFLVALAFVPIRLYQPDHIVANGENFSFYLFRPLERLPGLFQTWGSAASTFTIEGPNTNLLFVPHTAIRAMLAFAGLGPAERQAGLQTLLFFTGVGSIYFFTRYVCQGLSFARVGALVAAAFYLLNIFVITQIIHFETFFTAFAVLPLMALLLLRLYWSPTPWRAGGLFSLVSLESATLFRNPPTLVLVAMGIALIIGYAYLVAPVHHRPTVIWRTLMVGSCSLAVNLWWIMPTLVALSYQTAVVSLTSSDLSILQLVSQRSSFLNVLALNPTWGWTHQIYYPFAPRYESTLLKMTGYIPVVLAFSAVAIHSLRTRASVSYFAAVAAFCVFLTKGIHPPLGQLYELWYRWFPGAFLFREPTNKFPLLLLLCLAVLIAHTVAAVLTAASRSTGWRRWAGYALPVVVPVLLAANAHPLITGEAIPSERPMLPPGHVRIPQYWHDAADYLNGQEGRSRVLLLPPLDFYAMPYRWGYYAVDTLAQELIDRPVFALGDPGGYTLGSQAAFGMTLHIGQALDEPDQPLLPLLQALNVEFVLQRNDVDDTFPGRNIPSPDWIRQRLSAEPGVHFERSFGELDLYRVDLPAGQTWGIWILPDHAELSASLSKPQEHGQHDLDSQRRPSAQTRWEDQRLEPLVRSSTPTRYTVKISDVQRPFALMLAQAYHPEWTASVTVERPGTSDKGPTPIPSFDHYMVAGYANGWWIRQTGDLTIDLEYRPQRMVAPLATLSGVVMFGALMMAVAGDTLHRLVGHWSWLSPSWVRGVRPPSPASPRWGRGHARRRTAPACDTTTDPPGRYMA